MSHPRTGLNSYYVRLSTGEYLYSTDGTSTGIDSGQAQLWLWVPEQVDDKARELRGKLKCGGLLTAMRAK